jgi:hypothetical protein
MSSRSYYDPHFKPDRTAAKYKSDKKKDAASAQENAAFVGEFLSRYRPGPTGSPDPAATFQALRIEARQLSKLKGKPQKKVKKPKKPKKFRGTLRSSTKPNVKVDRQESHHSQSEKKVSHPWLKRRGSLRYLEFTDEELILEYFSVEAKIDRWRDERASSVDHKRRAVLATQVQIQYEKRHDLRALIYDRALSLDNPSSS